jgi:hypothetical protein
MGLYSSREQLDTRACRLVQKAITLENGYRGMFLQEDEVAKRVELLKEVLKICRRAVKGARFSA